MRSLILLSLITLDASFWRRKIAEFFSPAVFIVVSGLKAFGFVQQILQPWNMMVVDANLVIEPGVKSRSAATTLLVALIADRTSL